MFRTLPAMMPGYLHPPLPISSQTIPPRLPPPELTHRKVLNGTHQHRSAGSNQQGTYLHLHLLLLALLLLLLPHVLTFLPYFIHSHSLLSPLLSRHVSASHNASLVESKTIKAVHLKAKEAQLLADPWSGLTCRPVFYLVRADRRRDRQRCGEPDRRRQR